YLRESYAKTVHVPRPGCTLERWLEIAEIAYRASSTVSGSADDALSHAPGQATTGIFYDLPEEQHAAYEQFRDTHYPGAVVQFAGESGGDIVPPVVPPEPPSGLYIPYGAKLGIHALAPGGTPEYAAALAQAGAPVAVIKAVEDWGYLRLVKEASPQTLTIARKIQPFDGAGGIQDMTLEQIQTAAAQYMAAYHDYLVQQSQYDNGHRLAYIDYLELLNEPDPPGADGYRNLAWLIIAMLDIGESWELPVRHFACGGLNAGTPEWDEILAVANTGLLERIAYGDHVLTLHEGVLPFSDPIDKFWPGSIPGAPPVERAGALCGRYRYWLHIAQEHGLHLPIVISEFYSGPDYDPAHAADVIGRMAWYDNLVKDDPEILSYLPFTCGDWGQQNYSPFLPVFQQYAIDVRERQNATP
ncbi:MAG: hypothetical protein WC381_11755, partial [Kiritimatiellia bacterium]